VWKIIIIIIIKIIIIILCEVNERKEKSFPGKFKGEVSEISAKRQKEPKN
jgi:hypothetical protein